MKSITLLTEYEYGDLVYLKTDPDQLSRMVTGYTNRNGHITYELSLGVHTSWHVGVEISTEKVVVY